MRGGGGNHAHPFPKTRERPDQLRQLACQGAGNLVQCCPTLGRDIAGEAAGHDTVHHHAVGERGLRRPHHLLPMPAQPAAKMAAAGRAHIAEMGCDPFHLRHHPAEHDGTRGWLYLQRGLGGAGEGDAMRHGGVGGQAGGEPGRGCAVTCHA